MPLNKSEVFKLIWHNEFKLTTLKKPLTQSLNYWTVTSHNSRIQGAKRLEKSKQGI